MIKAVINVGTDLSQGSGDVLIPSTSASGYFTDGFYNEYRSTKQNKLFESYLNFNNGENNSKHLVDLTWVIRIRIGAQKAQIYLFITLHKIQSYIQKQPIPLH